MDKVAVQLTWKCNLGTCPYCWVRRRVADDPDFQHEDHTVEEWLPILNRLDPAIIDFAGGEPLAFKGFTWLLKNLHGKHRYAITSNLHDLRDLLQFIIDAPKYSCVAFTASYHPTSGILPSIFLKRLQLLRTNGFTPVVNIVDHISIRSGLYHTKEFFEKAGFRIDILPFYELDDLDEPHDKTFLCDAGNKHFMINNNGEVYRCCTWTQYSKRESLGNVFEGTFKKLPLRTLCSLKCRLLYEPGPLDDLPKILRIEEVDSTV